MEHQPAGAATSSTGQGHDRQGHDQPGHIEVRGIDVIPQSERHGSPSELFWVWAASNIVVTYIIGGAILIALGLSFWQSVVALLISGVFFLAVGLAAIPGPQAGTATMVISRRAFGLRGNFAPTLLSWLTVVGWEAVNLVLGAFALFALAEEAGITLSTPIRAVLFAVLALATYLVAILGHATIVYLHRKFTYVLGLLMVGVLIQVIPHADLSFQAPQLAASSSIATMILGVMILSAFSLGWTNYAADYTRYLPRTSSGRAIVTWTTLGGLVPYLAITMIGILAATAADLSDPIGGLRPLLASWYFVPFLIAVMGGTLTNNFLNTYTSGLNLLALGVRVKRWKTIPLDAVLASAAAVYAIFVYDFTLTFINFLSLQIIWLAPWCTVYLVDVWLNGNTYSPDLLKGREGRYWFRRGFNTRALIAWIAGTAAAFLFTNSVEWQSPISRDLLGGTDLSVPVGAAVAFVVYYGLHRYRTAEERGDVPNVELLVEERSGGSSASDTER